MFKNFTKKSTTVTVSAGTLKLKNEENKYSLIFIDSNIDYSLDFDIEFSIKYELNKEEQKSSCIFIKNEKNIICELNDIKSDDINIKILQNPNDNYDYLQSKTIIFEDFKDKEIYAFNAGKIQKGKCDDNIYTFKFINSKCQYNIENELIFYLKMKIPNRIAECKINKNSEAMLYDIECKIEGTKSCPLESDEDDIIVGNNEPSEYKISDYSYLYYISFANQSTIDVNYYLSGGKLTKKSVEKKNENTLYIFYVSDCTLNKNLEEGITFNISMNLDIYDSKSEEFSAECKLETDISDLNKFDLECSFTAPGSYYSDDNNYDIRIKQGNQTIIINDNQKLYISNFDSLSTVTLHNCQILKGNCDSNKKYSYKFSSCVLPQDISFENELEFTLKIKNNEISKCKIISSNKNEIQCEIENSNLCGDTYDIEIGDNTPEINYLKYPEIKNFYISGLRNLYTSTLTGGLLNYGKCESNSYIFTFTNTKLSKELLSETTFNLEIIEPEKMDSICTIPKNSKDFDLKCTINGDKNCPLSDEYSLVIKEITEEIQNDSLKPNTLYINNLKNRNIITINGGIISLGNCEGKKYKFSFKDSEIKGDINKDIIGKDLQFEINFKYPETTAECNLVIKDQNENKVNIECYIEVEGNDHCPMLNYTYLEIGENDPYEDNTTFYPNILIFSNFKGQKLEFNNYYISILEYKDNECLDENYSFNLSTTFKSDNIPSDEKIYLDLKNESGDIFNAECKFPGETTIESTGNINCTINKAIYGNLKLYFDYLYLNNKEFYIINQGDKQTFEFNGVQCPIFVPEKKDKEITPEKSESSSNTLIFIIIIKTSYTTEKEINIYNNNVKKDKNILEYNVKPFMKLQSINNLLEETENTCKCIVPEKTQPILEFTCSIENINDNKNNYFKLEDKGYIIKIDNIEIPLNYITELEIKNIFYKSDDEESEEESEQKEEESKQKEEESDQKEEESKQKEEESDIPDSTDPQPTPPDTSTPIIPNNEDDDEEESGISTAGLVILIIFIILFVITIILLLLYFFYFKKKDEGNDPDDNDPNQ